MFEYIHERTGMLPISLEVNQRRWGGGVDWACCITIMLPLFIPRVAMRWSLVGNRRNNRPKKWRRSAEREMKALGGIGAIS